MGYCLFAQHFWVILYHPDCRYCPDPSTVYVSMDHLFFHCALILLALTSLLSPVSAAPCSYKSPRRDQVLPPVSRDSTHIVNKRSAPEWGQLRIALHYDNKSLNALPTKQQRLIKEVVLPHAVKFWSDALKVLRRDAPIRLHRKCLTNEAEAYKGYSSDPSDTGIFYCSQGCTPQTFCGDVLVPDEHLRQCIYFTSPLSIFPGQRTRHAVGPPNGPGIEDADFLLYVSFFDTEQCKDQSLLGYETLCQQEKTYDRPIAGHINLCPREMNDNTTDTEMILATVKHEMLHVLGFSTALFAFYRDKTGAPRTPRDKFGRPRQWNFELNVYQWSETTIRHIERPDWQVRGGSIARAMDIMVTPRVVEETRRHFACPDLEGAELENQGGALTALGHWEKRVFQNEAMTGIYTLDPVYSNITFAALEDSGWYQPDYTLARQVSFGAGLGCEFAMKSCKSWMDRARQENDRLPAHPYCNRLNTTTNNNTAKTECSSHHNASSICNLVSYSKDLPPEYQNFDSIPGVPDNMVGQHGGSIDLADYCPFMEARGSLPVVDAIHRYPASSQYTGECDPASGCDRHIVCVHLIPILLMVLTHSAV